MIFFVKILLNLALDLFLRRDSDEKKAGEVKKK